MVRAARAIALLTERPRRARWGCYFAHADAGIVGTCAFKGEPDAEGTVEIAYMTFPLFERRGHAAAMVRALLAIARGGGATVVIAHTAPQESASGRVLRRNRRRLDRLS